MTDDKLYHIITTALLLGIFALCLVISQQTRDTAEYRHGDPHLCKWVRYDANHIPIDSGYFPVSMLSIDEFSTARNQVLWYKEEVERKDDTIRFLTKYPQAVRPR